MPSQSHSQPKQPFLGLVIRRPQGKLETEPFYEEVIQGMDSLASQHAYAVLHRVVQSSDEEFACYREWKSLGEVAGVVLVDLVKGDPRPDYLQNLGLPFVIMGETDERGVAAQPVNNYGAMESAVRNLARLGHRRLGRVSGPPELLHTQARGKSFEHAVRELGLSGSTVEGDYTLVSGYEATRQLLESSAAPTAIIYENDLMACGGLAAAQDRDTPVPKQLSLLAWDDSPLCQLGTPALSAMYHDIPALGEHLASALIATITNEPNAAFSPSEPRFIHRGTTAPPADSLSPSLSSSEQETS